MTPLKTHPGRATDQLRAEGHALDLAGDCIWHESEELLEAATRMKALARRMRAEADALDALREPADAAMEGPHEH